MTSQAPRQSMETHSARPQVEARRPRRISTPRTVTLRQHEPGGGVNADAWLSMQPASKHDFLQTPKPKPQAPELKCQDDLEQVGGIVSLAAESGLVIDSTWLGMTLANPAPLNAGPFCKRAACTQPAAELHACDKCEQLFHATCLTIHRRSHSTPQDRAGKREPATRGSEESRANANQKRKKAREETGKTNYDFGYDSDLDSSGQVSQTENPSKRKPGRPKKNKQQTKDKETKKKKGFNCPFNNCEETYRQLQKVVTHVNENHLHEIDRCPLVLNAIIVQSGLSGVDACPCGELYACSKHGKEKHRGQNDENCNLLAQHLAEIVGAADGVSAIPCPQSSRQRYQPQRYWRETNKF